MSSSYDLCVQQNTSSPASVLPIEILTDIFLRRAADSYQYYDSHSSKKGIPDWVNVSYTCRHWRSVALDCPSLWSHLFVVSKYWTRELLERSKGAPLKVHMEIGFPMDIWSRHFSIVAFEARRIEELRLYIWNVKSSEEAYAQLLPHGAMHSIRLKVLEVQASPWNVPGNALFGIEFWEIYLRRVHKRDMPWYSPHLDRLTSLILGHIAFPLQPNLEELLSTLGRAPNLRNLKLQHVLSHPVLPARANGASRKINLPHLTNFMVSEPVSTITVLLSCIHIPSKTEMKVECDGYDLDDDLPEFFHPLASLLAQRFIVPQPDDQLPTVPTIRTLVICLQNAEVLFSACEQDNTPPKRYRDDKRNKWGGSHIPLQVHIPVDESGDRALVVAGAHPKDATDLFVYGEHDPNATLWEGIFRNVQQVRLLVVVEREVSDLISTLSAVTCDNAENKDESVGDSHPLYAPNLEEMRLVRCKCDAGLLRKALETRKTQGRALKRLIIFDCDMKESELEDMPVGEVCMDY